MSSIKEIRQNAGNPKMLRPFAVLWCVIFVICCAFIWHKHATISIPCASGAALFFGLVLVCPRRILGPLYFAWMLLALGIGAIMSRVILTILFFGLFTPWAAIVRLMRGDFLDIHGTHPSEKSSYWQEVDPKEHSEYHQQY